MKRVFVVVGMAAVASVWALAPEQVEVDQAAAWARTAFAPVRAGVAREEAIVLRKSFPVRFDTTSRYGDIKLGERTFAKGVYLHANAELEFRLPQGAKRLTGFVGVNHDADTSGGRGSVVARVKTPEGKVLWQSPVMKGGEAPRAVDVDLAGATAFRIESWDAGDGYNCDQCDWGDLRIERMDGAAVDPATLPCAETNEVGAHWPFSFVYGGVSSRVFLDAWPCERKGDVLRFRDPEGRLEVDCVRVEHPGWPVAEWLLRFRNVSRENTKIIERVRPFDLAVPARAAKYQVHHAVGSPCRMDDYLQRTTPLKAKPSWEDGFFQGVRSSLNVKTCDGRSCDAAMPYFNLEGEGAGLIAAIGWGGQWTADFSVSASDGLLRMVAGQEDGRFYLKPGEEVRSPRAIALFWRRDHWLKAQNVWRAWMIARNVHRPDGKLVTHHTNGASSYYHGCNTAEPMTAANQKADIDRFLAEGVPLDYWWMDAAWYACEKNQWWKTGDWRIDPVRFPKGLREVTDHARAKGVKSIVWFEPERCLNGTPLVKEHPDFLYPGNDPRLLNLGKPEAWNWMVDRFEGFLRSERIDVYRQDFNMPPLDTWRRNDAQEKDRLGISEMKHVDAYHRWFAEILKRDPARQIDSCASGGRRNDVETMRVAVPLLRSDFTKEAVSQQSQTMGIGIWIPFYGASLSQVDAYSFRSWSTPYLHITADITRKDFDWASLRREIALWRKYLVPYFDKDFYPLAPFGVDRTAWAGWQFHDPATGSGAIQLFRRDASPYPVFEVRPFGLDPAKTYRVTDVDTGRAFTIRGGVAFDFRLDRPASAAILHYDVRQ